MSILARHKKPGGFEKLVQSLETTPIERRQKIIESMKQEDPHFMDRVERSIFDFEEFGKLPIPILMEVTYELGNMQWLALALFKSENGKLEEIFMKCLKPHQLAEYRDHKEILNNISKGQREAARFKIIEHARKLERMGKLQLKALAVD